MKHYFIHKGYYGVVHFSEEDGLHIGEVLGISDSISCHGYSVNEAKMELVHSIEHYLETCSAEGWKPCITDPDVARRMDLQFANERNAGVQHIPNGRLELVSAH